jgi:hypothetical protein
VPTTALRSAPNIPFPLGAILHQMRASRKRYAPVLDNEGLYLQKIMMRGAVVKPNERDRRRSWLRYGEPQWKAWVVRCRRQRTDENEIIPAASSFLIREDRIHDKKRAKLLSHDLFGKKHTSSQQNTSSFCSSFAISFRNIEPKRSPTQE